MRPKASRASSPNPTANLVGSRRAGLAQTPRKSRGVCHLGPHLRGALHLCYPHVSPARTQFGNRFWLPAQAGRAAVVISRTQVNTERKELNHMRRKPVPRLLAMVAALCVMLLAV